MAGDEQGIADGLVWQASAASVGPKRVPVAIADCEAILGQLRSDRRSQALSMRPLASLHAMAGHFDVARHLLEESNAIHEELGVGMHAAAAYDEGYVALIAGDPAAAEAALRPSLTQLAEMGDKALLATIAGLLARALVEQRREHEAWTYTRTVEETAAPGDLSAQILRRMVRAQLLARDGTLDEADELSAEAVMIADRTDWLLDRADALMARGEVLRALGRTDDAARAIHKAFELYTRKGNVVSANRARAAVDAVPASPGTRS
jgi:tetratricopeptide (TPR) repeat protein